MANLDNVLEKADDMLKSTFAMTIKKMPTKTGKLYIAIQDKKSDFKDTYLIRPIYTRECQTKGL